MPLDVPLPQRHVDHRRLDVGVPHLLHDGSRKWDPLNLIFLVYFDLMSRFPSFYSEGSGEYFSINSSGYFS
jgi:hypothetical protein